MKIQKNALLHYKIHYDTGLGYVYITSHSQHVENEYCHVGKGI